MLPQQPPLDWREKLTAILSAEGVKEVPHRSGCVAFPIFMARVFGWIIVLTGFFLLPFIVPDSLPLPIRWLVRLVLLGVFVLVSMKVNPRLHRLQTQFQGVRLGLQASRSLMKARRPPVLYLRSFGFDAVSARTAPWESRLFTYGVPGAELNLVEMLARRAPVLAIGRPGEPAPPSGASRFYVGDAIWRETIEALVPLCQLVICTTGHSQGLRWELEHIVKNLPPRRLLLWIHVQIGRWAPKERDAEWFRFLDTCRDVFPGPLPRSIERVQFLAFDDDWTPRPIPAPGYHATLLKRILMWPRPHSLSPFLNDRLP